MPSRSTLKLDLKNLAPQRPTPHIGRIGLVFISVAAMISTIASINSPSASTAMIVHYDRIKSEDLGFVIPPQSIDELSSVKNTLKPENQVAENVKGLSSSRLKNEFQGVQASRLAIADDKRLRSEVDLNRPLQSHTAANLISQAGQDAASRLLLVPDSELAPIEFTSVSTASTSFAAERTVDKADASLTNQKPSGSARPAQVLTTSTESRTARQPKIYLAMLAPSPIPRPSPVVNLVDAAPISAAVVAQQPDDVIQLPAMLAQIGGTDSNAVAATVSGRKSFPAAEEIIRQPKNNEPEPTTAERLEAVLVNADQEAELDSSAKLTNTPAKPTPDRPEPETGNLQTVVTAAPSDDIETGVASESAAAEALWHVEKVRKKDTLSQIFNRAGISSREAFAIAKLKEAKPLMRIRPGQKIEIQRSAAESGKNKYQLDALRFSVNRFDTLVIARVNESYNIETESREPVMQLRTAGADIQGSLLGAAKRADIPRDILYSLASIFGWKVDFAKHIQPGDSFSLIYEEMVLDDEVVGHGQIVAAELKTDGRRLQAVRHVDEDDRVTYYAPDGEGMQGSFLRSPIKFARVTSKYSKKRLHPIHKTWKAHKGVDYGAPMNTPIRATGDGVIKYSGRKKGYGKTVVMSHGDKYQTLYAHMNKFKKGLKAGSRVKQGDIIGYVGKTGWATGPHLHYEFRIHGKHKNPLTVELPSSLPIEKKYRAEFIADANRWVDTLERNGRIALARNEQ